jgi:hypothetical protein
MAALSTAATASAPSFECRLIDRQENIYRVTTILGEPDIAEDMFFSRHQERAAVTDSPRSPLSQFQESSADEVVARLEALDDVIFPAIEGNRAALQRVEPAWHQALDTLGPEAVRESRQQYLRYARATWEFLKNHTLERPHQLLAVMQIIMMLTGEDVN